MRYKNRRLLTYLHHVIINAIVNTIIIIVIIIIINLSITVTFTTRNASFEFAPSP